MNAVEIEEAVSKLAEAPFEPQTFPFAFLEAFGNKETTLKRLKTGSTNQSDFGGLLQRNNIHLKTCAEGEVPTTLTALRGSPATARLKAKFILATDGKELHAESLYDDEPPLACNFSELGDHFGYFLPLAGITTVKQIRENAFDIKATGRLNRLYVELSKHNPDWDTRREDLNHFFARLIFCFFAEDTGIFKEIGLFTQTVELMTKGDELNTHHVLEVLFLAMNVPLKDRAASDLPGWAMKFPYVNGGLFSGSVETPKFSKIARSYLLFVGKLNWKLINPDIFGSMIQAVADDEERGALGMHYTSVPNILKVLNPLFIDDLHQKLEEAGDGSSPASKGQLKRLRERLARIRVFDPACGSGNFLVIAYKEMRQIEATINERRDERGSPSVIPISNFRGIEIRTFAAEIARLALIIAEFQCDTIYGGELFARGRVLPLDQENWITCGNALRLDWLQICPPTGKGVKIAGDDLFNTPKDQTEIDFENAGGETYICGNPPYAGKGKKSETVSTDMEHIFVGLSDSIGYIDLAGCWFVLASQYLRSTPGIAAFVATNSVCQGQQLLQLWPLTLSDRFEICFAHRSFKWTNLASHNAGVICVVVGIKQKLSGPKRIFDGDQERVVANISPYLLAGETTYVDRSPIPISNDLPEMLTGSVVNDGGNLVIEPAIKDDLIRGGVPNFYFKTYLSSQDFINGGVRHVIEVDDEFFAESQAFPEIASRFFRVTELRLQSKKKETRDSLANVPNRFQHRAKQQDRWAIAMPRVSSAARPFLPAGLVPKNVILADTVFELVDAPLWSLSILASKIHLIWIDTVCGKLKTDYRYSNSLGWNSFPVPALSDQNKVNLTLCAQEILLAREAHFPATIADLYDPDAMPADLRAAHDRNDETLERIYIGRRFKNDTERLEKLFEMYAQMITKQAAVPKKTTKRKAKGADA